VIVGLPLLITVAAALLVPGLTVASSPLVGSIALRRVGAAALFVSMQQADDKGLALRQSA
jgi:hypothetical protein